MTYLLASDTCSAYWRGNQRVFPHLLQYLGRTAVSMITVRELLTWGYRQKSRRWLTPVQTLLADLTALDITFDVADQFASLRAELMDQGRPTPAINLFIAATAVAHGLVLVTRNLQDFQHIPQLQVVDWSTP
jgi:tRNA(fMet)-specific endonuclease VapC